METATVTREGDRETIHLPAGCHVPAERLSVRMEGNTIILEPLKPNSWPDGFFEEIRITDESFQRPEQGALPITKLL